jgi:hypothetical protein
VPRTFTKRLVIDASVARAAGPKEATYPTSKQCRDFLQVTLHKGHRFVMTPEIREEWERHQSGIARRWRTAMVQKGRLVFLENLADEKIRDQIDADDANEKDRAAMQKDVHVIEAAIATDKTVASLDDVVRRLFAEASRHIGEFRSVVWINPSRQEEKPIEWLKSGAKPEDERRLNYRQEGSCPHCYCRLSTFFWTLELRCSACHKLMLFKKGIFVAVY